MQRLSNVLWTSGWDSANRVADLVLNQRRAVQPFYVLDCWRRSTRIELRTQDAIRAALVDMEPSAADPLFAATPRPGCRTSRPTLRSPWPSGRYSPRSFLGGQYEWLARLAKHHGLILALCIHRDDRAHDFIADDVETTKDGSCRLVDEPSDPALEVFRHFRFPLFDTSKLEMQRMARCCGFSEIMELTWFCYNPVGGEPCGYCNPCRYTLAEGLGRRIPPPSLPRRCRAWRSERGVASSPVRERYRGSRAQKAVRPDLAHLGLGCDRSSMTWGSSCRSAGI